MSEHPKVSPVEVVKEESHYLRGEIPEELADGNDHFGKSSEQLLKHHGTYQQDDRDERKNARTEGKTGKAYIFMVRTKIPGGRITSDQLLAELDLCDEIGNSTLRITTRQGLQLHGVAKRNLKATIRRLNDIQLSTLGACGDVNRNVMCCPAPYKNQVYRQVHELCDQFAAHFAPRSPAYRQIWLTDPDTGVKEQVGGEDEFAVEPIYGKHYLPRKFKTAIGFTYDNCVDLYANDLGLLAIVKDGAIEGYNVLVGGGQGLTPSAAKTFAAVAQRMCYVEPEQVLAVSEAVVKVQRDFGNREDRKTARLKYLIHNWGLAKFKAKVEEYVGYKLPEPNPQDVHGFNDHLGWDEQGDGRWFYGLNVENGRILDNDKMQLKSALREICGKYQPGINLTSHQSLIFTDVAPEHKADLEAILRRHNVPLSEDISTVRRYSMACVAWPTCGLSITESERALPGVIDRIEVELARLGLSKEKFTVRMTGCPNGCARPYNCDVGLVGKALGKYTLYLGGRLLGNRLNFIYKDMIPEADVARELAPVFAYFKQSHEPSETFGDFCHRKGKEDLLAFAEQTKAA